MLRSRWLGWGTVMAGLALTAFPSGVTAQRASDADFLFGSPKGTFNVRFGGGFPRAESDIFDFAQTDFTIDDGDFNTVAFGIEVALRATEQVDISFGLHHIGNSVRSEYRDFVDQDDFPIQQDTEFRRTPLTVSGKFYFWERGRTISRLSWIPRDWTPYVGAGGGVMFYSFEQRGDFIDFDTFEVFTDDLTSTGQGLTGHVMGGVDVSVSPRFLINLEGRYGWASAEVEGDYIGFEDIDLSGIQATVGFAVRF